MGAHVPRGLDLGEGLGVPEEELRDARHELVVLLRRAWAHHAGAGRRGCTARLRGGDGPGARRGEGVAHLLEGLEDQLLVDALDPQHLPQARVSLGPSPLPVRCRRRTPASQAPAAARG